MSKEANPERINFSPPLLGVGMTYFPALEALFERCGNLLDVIEVEPQTLWFSNLYNNKEYVLDERAFDHLDRFPQNKLMHGVGMPLASSLEFDSQQILPWQQSINRLNPPWVSEHLAFMRFVTNVSSTLQKP